MQVVIEDPRGGLGIDVPPEKQLNALLRFKPNCRKVAILHSPETRQTVEAFRAAAEGRGVEIAAVDARVDHFADALDALTRSGCDAMVMVPDPQIYNTPTVKELLLWGLRYKKPVWAFSSNIVKAGAFGGQWIDPADHVHLAADLVARTIRGEKSSENSDAHGSFARKAVNENAAARLEISLEGKLEPGTVRFGDQP